MSLLQMLPALPVVLSVLLEVFRMFSVFLPIESTAETSLLSMYSTSWVFDGMRNVFSWTVIIVASNEYGHYIDGIPLFPMMLEQGVLPDGFAFSGVLQSCVGLGFIEFVEMVHAQVVLGLDLDSKQTLRERLLRQYCYHSYYCNVIS
ncbi:hypothetical protein K1719_001133 [Acacia pycnantha]|nr:hypothetical protein K1719_001133 [Acacia pycnantha]